MSEFIELEGVRVNNLKGINIKIRRNVLTVICGVSGSGKSSLAFDTLFAEGQRRYVETFSPYARQFLDRVERPAADRIEGIPPAIAIRQNARNNSARSTVGTRTETFEYLRTVFAKAGVVYCPNCDKAAVCFNPDSAAKHLVEVADGCRAMLVFVSTVGLLPDLLSAGFTRCIIDDRTTSLQEVIDDDAASDQQQVLIVADRIKVEASAESRIAESIEQVFTLADGHCTILADSPKEGATVITVDAKPWTVVRLSRQLACPDCDRRFGSPSPEMLNFQSPLGACPTCEGTGRVSGMSFDKVVPDEHRSLQDGAIQPWTTPAYRHELDELLELAADYGIPVDVPFAEISGEHRQLIHDGVAEQHFGGLVGFHRWLVRNRYKPGVSVMLNRWRSWLPCDSCHGTRLTSDAGALMFGGMTITQAAALEIDQLKSKLTEQISQLSLEMQTALSAPIRQLTNRIEFLCECGLGYLSLDRTMNTLSGGEAQRVVLTAVLGSGLINTLYVLDEPTSGLHADDTQKIINAARRLTALGNTVVVVEHDPDFIRCADEVIEIGPGAGDNGGEVVYCGTPADLMTSGSSVTATSLSSQHSAGTDASSKRTPQKWLTFHDVTCHNVNSLSGKLPLEVICAVSGVSGGGKSSLIVDALYPAICKRLGQTCDVDSQGMVGAIGGHELINDICLLDQSPLARSRRSIPATIVSVFDEIRKVMAETHEAKKRNYKAGMFSFNSARGGRCEVCEGHGVVTVEMQFLADIQTTCEACSGRRFRPDVLEVRYRDRSIHEILQMTVEQAFVFFNGHRKIQQRLNALRQAGLGYIRLGQPVSTLSGGESQRLRIAALLAGVPSADQTEAADRFRKPKSGLGTLFILDEPSTGLHMKDIDALMQCLNHLVEIGHSVIVIEHNQQVLANSDYQIQMGPGPGHLGGKIVACQ